MITYILLIHFHMHMTMDSCLSCGVHCVINEQNTQYCKNNQFYVLLPALLYFYNCFFFLLWISHTLTLTSRLTVYLYFFIEKCYFILIFETCSLLWSLLWSQWGWFVQLKWSFNLLIFHAFGCLRWLNLVLLCLGIFLIQSSLICSLILNRNYWFVFCLK